MRYDDIPNDGEIIKLTDYIPHKDGYVYNREFSEDGTTCTLHGKYQDGNGEWQSFQSIIAVETD